MIAVPNKNALFKCPAEVASDNNTVPISDFVDNIVTSQINFTEVPEIVLLKKRRRDIMK